MYDGTGNAFPKPTHTHTHTPHTPRKYVSHTQPLLYTLRGQYDQHGEVTGEQAMSRLRAGRFKVNQIFLTYIPQFRYCHNIVGLMPSQNIYTMRILIHNHP